MTIDVSEIVTDPELTESFTVNRPAPIVLSHEGVASVPSYTPLAFTGVVEPASAREIAMLPEGDRSSEILNFWSTQEMLASDGKGTKPDIIQYGSSRYIVIKSERWPANGGYFKATAKRYVQ